MKSTLLIVSLYDIDEHAQKFMKRIGVKYGLAVPQSMFDCWQFYMCEYDSGSLPSFVKVVDDKNPHDSIGFGLSKEMADEIYEWMVENGKVEMKK